MGTAGAGSFHATWNVENNFYKAMVEDLVNLNGSSRLEFPMWGLSEFGSLLAAADASRTDGNPARDI